MIRNPAYVGDRAKISTADKTIYIDKGASGANNGTSWTDAFESWADCKAWLTGQIIAHDWTIRVRKGATPYRETFDIDAFMVWGTLTLEAEYYWNGDCEANVGGAGEITDTGAFADVAIGDKVFILDLNGANGRAQDYELCTVDDISNIPDRIGTDGTKTPTTNWKYTIVRTEISGSDDGTDGGTARTYCFDLTSIDNITIKGFYLTFSDDAAIRLVNSRNCYAYYYILDDTDSGIYAVRHSFLYIKNSYVEATAQFGILPGEESYIDSRWCAITAPTSNAGYAYRIGGLFLGWAYIFTSSVGVYLDDLSWVYLYRMTIASTVTTGIYARYNSTCKTVQITNNATTPEDPVGTTEGAYIG